MSSKINQLINRRCEARTKLINVGGIYFLSSFHDQQGAFVRVLDKSIKQNSCGWNSSVTVEVIETVNAMRPDSFHEKYYAFGTVHVVNAANLYKNRTDASHAAKTRRL